MTESNLSVVSTPQSSVLNGIKVFGPTSVTEAPKAKKALNWEPKVEFKDLAKLMYDEDLKKLKK